MKVRFAGGMADSFRVGSAKAAADFGVDVAQHGILAEGAHARAIHSFYGALEAGPDHGARRRAVGHAHTLPKTIVERIVEIKNHAADGGLGLLSTPGFLTFLFSPPRHEKAKEQLL